MAKIVKDDRPVAAQSAAVADRPGSVESFQQLQQSQQLQQQQTWLKTSRTDRVGEFGTAEVESHVNCRTPFKPQRHVNSGSKSMFGRLQVLKRVDEIWNESAIGRLELDTA